MGWSQNQMSYSEMPLRQLFGINPAELAAGDAKIVRDRLLMAWEASKKTLESAKADEMELRNAFVKFAFDPSKTAGTERIELGGGYQAKAVKKETYGFIKNQEGKTDTMAINAALAKIEHSFEGGSVYAQRLVNWEPNFSVSEYKKLPAEVREVIDEVLEVKQGTPTLEIIAPKSKV